MMKFYGSHWRKIVFDHLRIRISIAAVNTILLCKICIKYPYASRAVCTYAHVFLRCALVGTYALIRKNMVFCLLKVGRILPNEKKRVGGG